MHAITVSTDQLAANLNNPNWIVVDARFDLMNAAGGRSAFDAGHIPGAQFVDLNHDLAGALTGRNGRHPLPDIDAFSRKLGAMGIGAGKQVIVYDQGSMMFVARLWWMLRWLGHDAVAILDGGFAAWQKEGRAISADAASPVAMKFAPQVRNELNIGGDAILSSLAHRARTIIDARAPERYRGDSEPIDAVGGHFPGALNRAFAKNLGPDGKLLPAAQIRAEFSALISRAPSENVVHACGSGVSACANILAMEYTGLQGSKLYVGSWSEWSSDASRPVEKG